MGIYSMDTEDRLAVLRDRVKMGRSIYTNSRGSIIGFLGVQIRAQFGGFFLVVRKLVRPIFMQLELCIFIRPIFILEFFIVIAMAISLKTILELLLL